MRMLPLLTCLLLVPSALFAADGSAFKPIDLATVPGLKGRVFPVVDNEATVNGRLVKRVAVPAPRDSSSKYAGGNGTVTFLNRSDKALRPDVTVYMYNRYGVVLDSTNVRWALTTIAPQETRSEKITLLWTPLRRAFQYSGLVIPPDFDVPAFVEIHDDSGTGGLF